MRSNLTAKAGKGQCISTKELARVLSVCTGRMHGDGQGREKDSGQEYTTVVFLEMQHYYTLQGVARIGKGCAAISGDSFHDGAAGRETGSGPF
mgnify:CR=1 FL=1